MATWTRLVLERGLPAPWAVRVVDSTLGAGRAPFARPSLTTELARTRRILRDLREALREAPGAVVHVACALGPVGMLRDALCAWLASRHGSPCVIHYHGLVVADSTPRRLALRAFAHLGVCHLAMNEPSRRLLARLSPGTAVTSLPNFFDERELPPQPLPAPEGSWKIVFAGNLVPEKGLHEVLAVARELPEARFRLVGAASEGARSALRAAPANVAWEGEVEHGVLLQILRGSDLLLFPTRHREGFPFVVCEAMALGLPVVSTAMGAIPEMVDDPAGGRIVAPEPQALVEAVRQVLQRPDRGRSLGRWNQEKAHRLYAYPVVSRRLAHLYEELARQGGLPEGRPSASSGARSSVTPERPWGASNEARGRGHDPSTMLPGRSIPA